MTDPTPNHKPQKYRLLFTVPLENADACKAAIFDAGAGVWENGAFIHVSFQSPAGGISQYSEVNSTTKEVGELVKVDEVKVDIMCLGQEVVQKAVEALKKAHPHGVVDYAVYVQEDF